MALDGTYLYILKCTAGKETYVLKCAQWTVTVSVCKIKNLIK